MSNESFLDAYQSHKKVAQCLLENQFYRESYLSMIIASECLLKGIFNCLKNQLFGNQEKTQARLMIESSLNKKEINFLSEKTIFGHNLSKLKETIKNLFREFDKGDYVEEYVKFSNAINNNIDCQKERYSASNNKIDWHKKSNEILSALNNLESKALSHFFGEVKNDKY